MQLIHINCESTYGETETDNAISFNMIHVEYDYEPILYEQPITSHIYQNHDHFLLNQYARPISNNKTLENIVEEISEKPTECSSTNNLYQNTPKKNAITKRKHLNNPTSFKKSKMLKFSNTRPGN